MTINAMTVSAGDALDVLKQGWTLQSKHGMPMSYMLHGRPGIGKTQIVEALAKWIGGPLYDIRLTQIDVSDLRGLPYYDHETKTTKWYRPEDLPSDEGPAVLFLDEITAASPFLTPTVYGLLQERRVGMHKLPDNVFIVAAGNTVDDGAVAYEMGTALADRLVHMYVQASAQDWLKSFAIPNNLHPAVQAFIKVRGDLLETSVEAMKQKHMIAATPRSWEKVSNVMYHVQDRRMRMIMISGIVGESVTSDFMTIAEDIAATVQIEAMLKANRADRTEMYPTNMYGLNAMIFGLAGTLSEETLLPTLEILYDLRDLATKRPGEEGLAGMPLRELMTNGIETIMQKSLDGGFSDKILDSKDYLAYEAEREAEGL